MENVFTPWAFGSGPPPFPPPTCGSPCPCPCAVPCAGFCPSGGPCACPAPPPPICCIGIIPVIGIVATTGIFIVGNPVLVVIAPAPPPVIPGPAAETLEVPYFELK